MPQILIGEIRRVMGIFLGWLNNSNLSGSTYIYKQSWVPELVKYIKANCCKSATFLLKIRKPHLSSTWRRSLHKDTIQLTRLICTFVLLSLVFKVPPDFIMYWQHKWMIIWLHKIGATPSVYPRLVLHYDFSWSACMR